MHPPDGSANGGSRSFAADVPTGATKNHVIFSPVQSGRNTMNRKLFVSVLTLE